MCGIVGFTGTHQAAPILLDALKKLEYRGYDSSGLAVRDESGKINVVRAKGKLSVLSDKTDNGKSLFGTSGIGHTRWATHGEPSEKNAHPHTSNNGTVFCVHNGIIENYQEIRSSLMKKGYEFFSETDTETAVNLVEYYYNKFKMGPLDAISRAVNRMRGSFALEFMFSDYPEEIYVVRRDAPMIIGIKDNETFVASDIPAILKYTKSIYYIDDNEIARLKKGSAEFFNLDLEINEKELKTIEMDEEAAEKGGFEHFMLKEIHEEPRVLRDTLNSVLKNNDISFENIGLQDDILKNLSEISIVACGSAYHVGMALKYVFEKLSRIRVTVDIASEFRYRDPIISKDSLIMVISQSGETADTLAALRLAKKMSLKTLAVVNVSGSSIAREADYCFYTLAGPEISVATTKAYSCQLLAGYLIAVKAAFLKGMIDESGYRDLLDELSSLPANVQKIIDDKERIQWFSSKQSSQKDVFFVGRGIDYAAGLEGSLKLKEISYIHSEAYAAGELKHGTISLIEKGILSVGILTQPDLYEKTVSNLVEIKSRGGYIMAITNCGNYSIEDTADFTVYIPKTNPLFSVSLSVIVLQLLSYYVSVARGLDVDKPRNLAKSVTVE